MGANMTDNRIVEFRRGPYRFDVVDTGPLDGPIAILLHGFPQSPASWTKVAALLNERGIRTLAPMQRGYAVDARPRWRWQYRSSQLFADIDQLIATVGSDVHVVGHDWGAHVAWGVAGTNPAVRSVTAVSVPHSAAFVRSWFTSNQLLKSWYMFAIQIPLLADMLPRLSRRRFDAGLRSGGMTDEMIESVNRDVIDTGGFTGALNWYRGMPFASPSAIRRIKIPTAYVWSDRDIALGPVGARLTERYVDGPYRFEVFEGASHWIPDERPVELAAVIGETIESAEK